MKKILSIICTAVLLCSVFAVSANADVQQSSTAQPYTAAELVTCDLYEIIDKLGDNYIIEFGRGGMGLTYPDYNYTIVTDQDRTRTISTPNDLFEPLSDEEIAAFKKTLDNKTAKLKMITVFSDGKLNENISANMYYNDSTKYYGEFNCELVTQTSHTATPDKH